MLPFADAEEAGSLRSMGYAEAWRGRGCFLTLFKLIETNYFPAGAFKEHQKGRNTLLFMPWRSP